MDLRIDKETETRNEAYLCMVPTREEWIRWRNDRQGVNIRKARIIDPFQSLVARFVQGGHLDGSMVLRLGTRVSPEDQLNAVVHWRRLTGRQREGKQERKCQVITVF